MRDRHPGRRWAMNWVLIVGGYSPPARWRRATPVPRPKSLGACELRRDTRRASREKSRMNAKTGDPPRAAMSRFFELVQRFIHRQLGGIRNGGAPPPGPRHSSSCQSQPKAPTAAFADAVPSSDARWPAHAAPSRIAATKVGLSQEFIRACARSESGCRRRRAPAARCFRRIPWSRPTRG